MAIITLLSDFGVKDPYVAEMKGVILHNCPEAKIVDITHEVEPHNILMGSFLLETAVPYFPDGTVHVAVVDPGVGSMRLPIVVKCRRSILVGPDNGLLVRAAKRLGFRAAYQIQRVEFTRRPVSGTFHGRDVFAHAAGLLATRPEPQEVGPRVSKLVRLDIPEARISRGVLRCSVLHVDVFGNIITNAEEKLLMKLEIRPRERVALQSHSGKFEGRYVGAYHEVGPGHLAILRGSQGYVEVAVREDSASARLGLRPLDELELRLVR